jgi:phosphoglycerol transferase MdoB-like AlkP superfamily enzyme
MTATPRPPILKTFFLHFVLLTLICILFRIFFAQQMDWLNWQTLSVAIPHGVPFDLAVASVFSAVFTTIAFLFNKPKLISVAYFILLSNLSSDLVYFFESGRHIGYELSNYFSSFFEITAYAFKFFWLFLPSVIAPIAVWRWSDKIHAPSRVVSFKNAFVSFIVVLLVVGVSIRGFNQVPQNPSFAYRVGDHKLAQVSLNGTYNMFFAVLTGGKFTQEKISIPPEILNNQTIEDIVSSIYLDNQPSELKFAPVKYNIVFMLLEGWSASLMKSYGGEDDVTPNFDRLRTLGLTTTLTIAGGKRTTEGMLALFCGFQNPLGRTVVLSPLEGQKFNCLPQLLSDKGWDTAFYQGSHEMTSGVGSFARKIGFTKSRGKLESPNHESLELNSWGLYDNDMYLWILEDMKTFKQPFLIGINTNTTHELSLPKNSEYKFGKETLSQKSKSVLFKSDQDLAEFISAVEKQTWEYPILFVLVADHTSRNTGSVVDGFRIPFAIYSKELASKHFDYVITQRDIAPTVLDLMGLEEQNFAGISLFKKSSDRIAEFYHSGRLGAVNKTGVIDWKIDNPLNPNCSTWSTSYSQLQPSACSEELITSQKNALAFTKYSQDLLFKSQAKDFYTLLRGTK